MCLCVRSWHVVGTRTWFFVVFLVAVLGVVWLLVLLLLVLALVLVLLLLLSPLLFLFVSGAGAGAGSSVVMVARVRFANVVVVTVVVLLLLLLSLFVLLLLLPVLVLLLLLAHDAPCFLLWPIRPTSWARNGRPRQWKEPTSYWRKTCLYPPTFQVTCLECSRHILQQIYIRDVLRNNPDITIKY